MCCYLFDGIDVFSAALDTGALCVSVLVSFFFFGYLWVVPSVSPRGGNLDALDDDLLGLQSPELRLGNKLWMDGWVICSVDG